MQFNFVLTNHGAATLQAFDDMLRPLFFGLRAAGHRVVAGARQLEKAPIVNVMVDDFGDPTVGQAVQAARRADLRLGIVLPLGLGAPEMTPARRDGLQAVLAGADFAWTLGAVDVPPALLSPDRVAVLRYGFHDSLIGPRLIADPAARDIDVVVYGPNSPRFDGVVAQLAAAQRSHFPVRTGLFPDYIVTDLLSRAKTVAVVGASAEPQASLGPHALKAVCNGALAVVERGSVADPLAGVVVACGTEEIVARCGDIVAEGRFVERGLGALEQLRVAPGMRESVEAALAVVGARPGR